MKNALRPASQSASSIRSNQSIFTNTHTYTHLHTTISMCLRWCYFNRCPIKRQYNSFRSQPILVPASTNSCVCVCGSQAHKNSKHSVERCSAVSRWYALWIKWKRNFAFEIVRSNIYQSYIWDVVVAFFLEILCDNKVCLGKAAYLLIYRLVA